MGILDDAIRQHLELKRRHGVPEQELQRQEEEALGPARRDVAQQREEAEPAPGQTATAEADEAAAPAAVQETALLDRETSARNEAAPTATDEGRVEDEPHAAVEPTPVEPPPVEPPPHEPDPHVALRDTEPHGFEALEEEEQLADKGADEREDEDEELLSAEEEAEAEAGDPDVLEDTPDFLQETPEHDRLWFEQKPPRDFDFD